MKDKFIQIRCTEDEKLQFGINAKKAGFNDVSDFVRERCLEVKDKELLNICLSILAGTTTPDNISPQSLSKLSMTEEMRDFRDFDFLLKSKSIDILIETIT